MEDNPTSKPSVVCNICGDAGVVEAIVTCARCKTSHEHIYCKRTYQLNLPEIWVCEECEALINGSSLNAPGKLQCDSRHPNELPNELKQNPLDGKKVQTGKVKPLSVEEVIMLTSGAGKSGSPVKALRSSIVHRKRVSMLDSAPPKIRGVPPKSNPQPVTRNPSLEISTQSRLTTARQQVVQSFEGLRGKGASQAPVLKQSQKEYIQSGQPITAIKDNAIIRNVQKTMGNPATAFVTASLVQDNQPIFNSEKDAARAPLEKLTKKGQPMNTVINKADIRRAQFAVENASIASISTSSLRIDLPIVNSGLSVSANMIVDPDSASASANGGKFLYIPAAEASWKGSFKVLLSSRNQGEIIGDIEGHPPSSVRKKVYESSKLMPEVLQFELVQRGALWTSLFGNCGPDRRDIGLYFFPSTSGRCENYISLLEHIEAADLVLRKCTDGLELLIFHSKLLHMDCQRWNGMYFFWGLFRHHKLTINNTVNQCRDEGNGDQVVEMEIDMIGGEHVGRVDMVVPRIPLLAPSKVENESFNDIAVPRMPLLLAPPKMGKEPGYDDIAIPRIPPGFEYIYGSKVQISDPSAAETKGFGACLQVQKPGEDNSVAASSKPKKSLGLNVFQQQQTLKKVKSEL